LHPRPNSVSLGTAPGANNAFGTPIPPFLPQTMTATISNNDAGMFVAKYTAGALKLFAGYEYIRYSAPSDFQTAFTTIAGDFVCAGCAAFNNTNINNLAFGVNGLGNKILAGDVDRHEIRRDRPTGRDRRLLSLHPELLFRHGSVRASNGVSAASVVVNAGSQSCFTVSGPNTLSVQNVTVQTVGSNADLTLQFVDFGDGKPVRAFICTQPNQWA
jgi:hypothetical protein